MASIKKYQKGGSAKPKTDTVVKKPAPIKPLTAAQRDSALRAELIKNGPDWGGGKKKAKAGGSFPDLNKDGKITKADILKGRGVIKNGGKMKKACKGATVKNVSKRLGSSKLKNGGKLTPSKTAVSKRLASAHTRIAKCGKTMKKK